MSTPDQPEECGGRSLPAYRLVAFWSSVAILTFLYALLVPAIVLPRSWVLAVMRTYLAAVLWLLQWLCGLQWKIIGSTETARQPVMVAAKHQSAFETLILQYILGDPCIILKKELLSVPLFGWVLRRLGHIGVERSGDPDGVRRTLAAARKAHEEGRPIVIFPEGSRRQIGAQPDYKSGVDVLYAVLKVPCVPVAVNSGKVWPARSLTPGPGEITIEFLPTIYPGLPRARFGMQLEKDIETATARLLTRQASGTCHSGKEL